MILHSRRAFGGMCSMIEAKHFGLLWAMESMCSHKVQKICFEVEAPELVGAVVKPIAWPAFRAYGKELGEALSKFSD